MLQTISLLTNKALGSFCSFATETERDRRRRSAAVRRNRNQQVSDSFLLQPIANSQINFAAYYTKNYKCLCLSHDTRFFYLKMQERASRALTQPIFFFFSSS